MNKVRVTHESGAFTEFENVVAHQIGNGAIQLVFHDGIQRIIFDPLDVEVIPDEQTKERWKEQSKTAYDGEGAKEEKALPKLKVVQPTEEGSTDEIGN